MEGGGTRVFTKQGKLKKVKKPKKEKKRKGVGPQTFVKKQEIEIPKNEIIEVPKPRGRPRKEPAFVPFVFNPPPPKSTTKTKGFEYLKDRTSRLGQSLGDKFRDAIANFKALSKAEKREKLEKLATYKTSYITPEEVNKAKTIAKLEALHLQNLVGVQQYQEAKNLGVPIQTLEGAELGVETAPPKKPKRGKSLERAEPPKEPFKPKILSAAEAAELGIKPLKKKGPPLPARPPQVSPPLTFPQLDKPAKAKRGRPKKTEEPQEPIKYVLAGKKRQPTKSRMEQLQPVIEAKEARERRAKILAARRAEKTPLPSLRRIPKLSTPPTSPPGSPREEQKPVEKVPKKARPVGRPRLRVTPVVTPVEAEKEKLLGELKKEVQPKLKGKVAKVQSLDKEDEEDHDEETRKFAALAAATGGYDPADLERAFSASTRRASAARSTPRGKDPELERLRESLSRSQTPADKLPLTKDERELITVLRDIVLEIEKRDEEEQAKQREDALAYVKALEASILYEKKKVTKAAQKKIGSLMVKAKIRFEEAERLKKAADEYNAAVAAQKLVRGKQAKSKLEELKQEKKIEEQRDIATAKAEASIEKKKTRGRPPKQVLKPKTEEVKAKREAGETIATKLQSIQRGRKPKAELEELKEGKREEAKSFLQEKVASIKKEKEKEAKAKAATAERGRKLAEAKAARIAKAEAKKAEEEAIEAEQAERVRELQERRELIQKGAATRLQSVQRGRKPKAELAKLKEEKKEGEAALKLQSAVRAYKPRKELAAYKTEKELEKRAIAAEEAEKTQKLLAKAQKEYDKARLKAERYNDLLAEAEAKDRAERESKEGAEKGKKEVSPRKARPPEERAAEREKAEKLRQEMEEAAAKLTVIEDEAKAAEVKRQKALQDFLEKEKKDEEKERAEKKATKESKAKLAAQQAEAKAKKKEEKRAEEEAKAKKKEETEKRKVKKQLKPVEEEEEVVIEGKDYILREGALGATIHDKKSKKQVGIIRDGKAVFNEQLESETKPPKKEKGLEEKKEEALERQRQAEQKAKQETIEKAIEKSKERRKIVEKALEEKPKKEKPKEEKPKKEKRELTEEEKAQNRKINNLEKKPIRKSYPQFKPLFDELGITSLEQFEDIPPKLQKAILRLSARETLYPDTMTKERVDRLEELASKVGKELSLLEIAELEREERANEELSSEEEGEEESEAPAEVPTKPTEEQRKESIRNKLMRYTGIDKTHYGLSEDVKEAVDNETDYLFKQEQLLQGQPVPKEMRADNEERRKELKDLFRGIAHVEHRKENPHYTKSVVSIGAETTESEIEKKAKQEERRQAKTKAKDEGEGSGLPYGRAKGMGDLSDGDVESQDGGGSDQEEKLSHYTYIMPSPPILRRGFKHPAMVSPGMSDHLHPNAAANIHAFSGGLLGRGLGRSRSRSRSPSPDDMGMGMSGCGSMKDKMAKMYKKAVPKSLRPAVEELGSEAVDYALKSKKVKGMRQDAKEKYEKTVPKSLRPAVAELAKDTGEFAKRQSGFGLKKGSDAARKFMAELRARKGKKMKGGVIPSPPSRSPITDSSLL